MPPQLGDPRLAAVSPVVAALLAELGPAGLRDRGAPVEVVDIGGGTGGVAVPLAMAGHRVTVIDPSPDSLAALERRAAEAGVAGSITPRQGDLDDLPRLFAAGAVPALVCHGVLDVVDDRAAALATLAASLAPGGLLSVVTANRTALLVQRAIAGRFREAADYAGPAPASRRPVDLDELTALVAAAGLVITSAHGVRTLRDLVPGSLRERDPQASAEFAALEQAAATVPALRAIASQLHLLARRPA